MIALTHPQILLTLLSILILFNSIHAFPRSPSTPLNPSDNLEGRSADYNNTDNIEDNPITLNTIPATYGACVSLQNWTAPQFNQNDCNGAIHLIAEASRKMGSQVLEFWSPNLGPEPAEHSPFESRPTPFLFSYGTCVIGLALIPEFEPGMLPDLPKHPHPPFETTDLGTFANVHGTARLVLDLCAQRGIGGWRSLGFRSGSVTVTVFAAASGMDRFLSGKKRIAGSGLEDEGDAGISYGSNQTTSGHGYGGEANGTAFISAGTS